MCIVYYTCCVSMLQEFVCAGSHPLGYSPENRVGANHFHGLWCAPAHELLLANSHEKACWAEERVVFKGELPLPDHEFAARCSLVTIFCWYLLNISKEMMQRMHSEAACAAQ